MNPQLFLAFLVVAVALACTPGVDWAYSIAAGLRQRSFVPAVAGLCGGYVLHTVLLVLGLAALLAGMPGVLGWLTGGGRRSTCCGWASAPCGPGAGPASAPARLLAGAAAPRASSGSSSRAWASAGSTPRACCSSWPWCRSSSALTPRCRFRSSRAARADLRPARGRHLQLRGTAGPETAAGPAGRSAPSDAGQRDHHGGPGRLAARRADRARRQRSHDARLRARIRAEATCAACTTR